ncbi:hypothetical protein ACWIUH_10835 [Ursidibacter arcticus]
MKKLILIFSLFYLTSCAFIHKQFFLAKNPTIYYYSALDILNSEIYIQKYGWNEFYSRIEMNQDIPEYVAVLPRENNKKVLGRNLLSKDEFIFYIKNILPSLENTEFYKHYDRNKIYDRHQVVIFNYGIENMLATVEDIKGKVKIIRLEDDKAYIKIP